MTAESTRFPLDLMYAAATQYYLKDATQAQVAGSLGVSRPTVSRLLSEARRLGIVQIRVRRPESPHDDLAAEVAQRLQLAEVHLVPTVAGPRLGPWLAPGLVRALASVRLGPGDVVLVSSGRTVYECAKEQLPQLPGVVVVPAVGGQEESEAWYQTNEITRVLAERVGGRPVFLYAPALPGPELARSLRREPSFERVCHLWGSAACVIMGVGTAPTTRSSLPAFVPSEAESLRAAVGDVCSHFYDRSGKEVGYPGSRRLVATSLADLRRVPVSIAVAVGDNKAVATVAAARAGYFNRLVTDVATASAILSVED